MQLRTDSAKMLRCLTLLLCTIGLTLICPSLKDVAGADEEGVFPTQQGKGSADDTDTTDKEGVIDGTSDEFEQNEKEGWTLLIGDVKINRPDGFLNADRVTIHEDVETDETTKTVAEGNVELRDGDVFATCDHAILNHITDIIELRDNVVVIQDEDRLESDFFTFNRRTGKRIGKGNIKFRVRIKQKKETQLDQTEESDSKEEK